MKTPGGTGRLGLVLLAVCLGPGAGTVARAQNFGSLPYSVPLDAAAVPVAPAESTWCEVIMANAKWLVVQNQQGQQFPVRIDSINRYMVRWPATTTDLTEESMVEAIGTDLGSNTVTTEHIDVFEGSAQSLVTPRLTSFLPGGRVMTALDPGYNRTLVGWNIAEQASLYSWAFPLIPQANGIPSRLHVVGSVAGLNPLRLAIPGQNFATVLPPTEPGTFTVSQVTLGAPNIAQKGDLAFVTPLRADPETLAVSQLVLYKKIRMTQFAR